MLCTSENLYNYYAYIYIYIHFWTGMSWRPAMDPFTGQGSIGPTSVMVRRDKIPGQTAGFPDDIHRKPWERNICYHV